MERRVFLRWCGSGVVFGVIGCVPGPARRERGSADLENSETMDAAPRSSMETDSGGQPDAGLSSDTGAGAGADAGADAGAGAEPPDAGFAEDSGNSAGEPDSGPCELFVELHDTYAQALYFDGTYGPLTGTITVAQVIAGTASDMEFWHGHGGLQHHFVVTPEHFAALKRGERAMVETTEVDSHTHLLFIDPVDESYRVPGAPDVRVPLC